MSQQKINRKTIKKQVQTVNEIEAKYKDHKHITYLARSTTNLILKS